MLKNYFARHCQAGLYSLGNLIRAPFASFMTCLIIGITLALPAVLFVALKNAELLSNTFQQTMQITLYLKDNVTENETQALARDLQTEKDIKSARAISPADGLKELQKQAGFDVTPGDLQNNPLPWVIVILPTEKASTPAALEHLQARMKRFDIVDNVQLDILWVKRLASLITLTHRIMYALAIFLGLAVLLIINDTIRSTTEQHQKEIEVIQLIGGTDAFIRRPFLYAGIAYGLLGGIIAWLLVEFFLLLLKNPAHRLAELYSSDFHLAGMGLTTIVILLVMSMSLGLMGSWIAVTKYLQQQK